VRIALKLQIHNLENRSKKDWKFKKQLKHRSIKSKVALELQTNRDYVESKKGKYEDKEIQHSTQVSSSGGQDSSGGGVSECSELKKYVQNYICPQHPANETEIPRNK